MKIQAVNDRIIVKRDEGASRRGPLIIPPMAIEKPQRGTVVTVGIGRTLENGVLLPMAFKPGDKILFGKYSGVEFELGEHSYVAMREGDVIALIDDETE